MFPSNLKNEPVLSGELISQPWLRWFQGIDSEQDNVVVTFHAGRSSYSSRNYPNGTILYETDRNALFVNINRIWTWTGGEMQGTLVSPSSTLPDDLGPNDAGFLFRALDFGHLYRWTGTQWTWGDPSDASGRIAAFAIAPAGGWHLCDGTTGVVYALEDGSTDTVDLPDLTTGAYLKGGVYDGIVNPAVAPTISGNTGSTSAGTPSGTVSQPTFAGNPLGSANVQSGSGASVVPGGATPSGTVSQPTFTGTAMTAHLHSAGTLVNSTAAEPKNLKVGWYFRI